MEEQFTLEDAAPLLIQNAEDNEFFPDISNKVPPNSTKCVKIGVLKYLITLTRNYSQLHRKFMWITSVSCQNELPASDEVIQSIIKVLYTDSDKIFDGPIVTGNVSEHDPNCFPGQKYILGFYQ